MNALAAHIFQQEVETMRNACHTKYPRVVFLEFIHGTFHGPVHNEKSHAVGYGQGRDGVLNPTIDDGNGFSIIECRALDEVRGDASN